MHNLDGVAEAEVLPNESGLMCCSCSSHGCTRKGSLAGGWCLILLQFFLLLLQIILLLFGRWQLTPPPVVIVKCLTRVDYCGGASEAGCDVRGAAGTVSLPYFYYTSISACTLIC